MKLGILGGTFDPVHIGHLIIAQEAIARLKLDEVWFIPTGVPWMKAGNRISPAHHRLEMVRLALECDPRFRASEEEIRRPGASYTVDTLEALKQGEAGDASLYFILGMDALETVHRWHQAERLFEMCTLVAVSRPSHSQASPASLETISPRAAESVVFLEGPDIGVSGAEIRRRVAEGLPIKYWVPRPVERYIADNALYLEASVEP